MVEIPVNTYKVECDPEVEKVAKIVLDELNTSDEVTIFRHSTNETSGVYADKHIAERVGKMFVKAGYYASVYTNTGGYFGWLKISKKPQDNSFECRSLS